MLTTQKVAGVLKKAGFLRAVPAYSRRRPRRLVRWLQLGYRLTVGEDGTVIVESKDWLVADAANPTGYAKTLLAAGLTVEDKGSWLIVRDGEAE